MTVVARAVDNVQLVEVVESNVRVDFLTFLIEEVGSDGAMDTVKIAASKTVSKSTHGEVRGLEYLWRLGLGGIEAVDERDEAQ